MIKYDETYKEYLYESNSKHNTNILYKLYFGIEVDWSDINFKKNKEIIVNLKRGKIIEGIKIEYGILLKKLKEITNDYNSIYMFNGMVLKDDTKLNLFYGEIIDIIPSTLDNFNINIISKNNPITSINISPRTTYRNLQVLIAILIYKDSRIYSQIELNLYNKSLKDNFELKPNDIVYYRRKY
ncbi:MAG: hypothetical protein CMF62_03310 [Magnetococcales bacterium]|nr:hypothetical protein [Magnetococcales bacterium]